MGQVVPIYRIPVNIKATDKTAKSRLKKLSNTIRRDHAQKKKPQSMTLRAPYIGRRHRSLSPRKKYGTMPGPLRHSSQGNVRAYTPVNQNDGHGGDDGNDFFLSFSS